ncbi:hypothetical protein [Streptomyces neyagawaensis]|uniref:hypothetical protein n=1 Tax=Streptomyces neyagawaensis TaxID=42238 RepID=UPI0007C85EC1|nr:hypothetical protein [Streptomyces neyagawaensis]MCL6734699.1 hypothetical protein [Streptomyces neyagawaensis]MDE1682137.1 hypothetical protein [Streptomyces neyagawaensis]
MEFAVLLALLLVLGAVVAVIAQRRHDDGRGATSDLDAEADANRWVVRLGGGLAGIDVRAQAGADEDAARALADAAERLRTARARLASARTPDQYAAVVRTATEGLRHVGEARRALGLDPAAEGERNAARVEGRELSYGLDASYRS